jgi:hypothetical protein
VAVWGRAQLYWGRTDPALEALASDDDDGPVLYGSTIGRFCGSQVIRYISGKAPTTIRDGIQFRV